MNGEVSCRPDSCVPRGRKSGIAPATGSPARWSMSRPLSEEVTFDRAKIISPDRLCYSIPTSPRSSIRPVAAALANAVFDATGVRLRRAPLTPERLQRALA
jgi:hypothetical protein